MYKVTNKYFVVTKFDSYEMGYHSVLNTSILPVVSEEILLQIGLKSKHTIYNRKNLYHKFT